MLHDNLQMSVSKAEKIVNDSYKTDRPNFLHRSQSNNYQSETRQILQRQRLLRSFLHKSDENEIISPSIRKPITIATKPKSLTIKSIPTANIFYNQWNFRNTNMKKELQRQSAIFVRRPNLIEENSTSPFVPSPDTAGAHLLTSRFNFVTSSPTKRRHAFPLSPLSESSSFHLRSTSVNVPKSRKILPNQPQKPIHRSHELIVPKWTPTLFSEDDFHHSTSNNFFTSKSLIGKYPSRDSPSRNLKRKKPLMNLDFYLSHQVSLFSPDHRYTMNKTLQDEFDHCFGSPLDMDSSPILDEPFSDEDEPILGDDESSMATCNSRLINERSSSSSDTQRHLLPIKRQSTRRRLYHIGLPPVFEQLDDDREETTVDQYV